MQTHIAQITVKNFKAVQLVDISPTGEIVTIAGDNGEGKTSILQAIASILGGKGYQPERPVRDGAERAEVAMRLDDGHALSLKIQPDGGRTLEVRAPDGSKIASPQTWLDRRVRSLAFDPLTFMRAKAGEQAETLRKIVGLDLTQIDAVIARVFAEREVQGRVLRMAEGAAASLPRHADAPAQKIDVSALHLQIGQLDGAAKRKADLQRQATAAVAEASDATAAAADNRRRAGNKDAKIAEQTTAIDQRIANEKRDLQAQADATAATHAANIQDYEAQIAALQARIAATKAQTLTDAASFLAKIDAVSDRRDDAVALMVRQIEARAADLARDAETFDKRAESKNADADRLMAEAEAIELPDVSDLQARVADAVAANAKVDANTVAATADDKARAEKDRRDELTAEIEEARQKRKDMIRACKMPVAGLDFDDDGMVLFAGRPLCDASHAEQTRVTMAISAAQNPDLSVVLIDEANSLDRKSLAIVAQEAKALGLQVWMVRIEGGDGAYRIEGGEIARVAQPSLL